MSMPQLPISGTLTPALTTSMILPWSSSLLKHSWMKRDGKHKYPTRQNPGRFSNPCRTHFLGLEKRTFPGKRGRLVTIHTPYRPTHRRRVYSVLCFISKG